MELHWMDVSTLQSHMASGEVTAVGLVEHCLARIAALDSAGPELNSIIEVSAEAGAIAADLDAERARSGARGPLHGIPVVLKANIDTADRMATTAGSVALAGHHAAADAPLVERLREAGAVVLAKTNLSEWANFRSPHSSSGWSSLGGQTRNPHNPVRNPCGSSSGSAVAVAAGLAPVAVGTETDGSIVCPAGVNGVVGIKPTVGHVSQDGIIPIAASQDTAGPMARNVRDAAAVLHAMRTGSVNDRGGVHDDDLLDDLRVSAPGILVGARVGVLRTHRGAGSDTRIEAILDRAIGVLSDNDVTIIDPIEVDVVGLAEAELEVLLHEFGAGLDAYLSRTGGDVRNCDELIEYNRTHADVVMPHFGQERLEQAVARGGLDATVYLAALEESKRIACGGLDGVLAEHDLDALIAPTNGPAWLTDHVNGDSFSVGSSTLPAVAGYPNVTVPAGAISGLPIGMSFIGGAYRDADVIRLAHAFEQLTHAYRPPPLV